MNSFRHIHVFGLGRAGLSLARSCMQAGLELGYLWNRSELGAQRSQQLLHKEVHRGKLQPAVQAFSRHSLVVIAVHDQAIASFSEELQKLGYLQSGQVLIHLAGALGPEILQRPASQDLHLGVFHPLRALDAEQSLWRNAVCGLSGDKLALKVLHELAQHLGCQAQEIDPAQRALYHAAAALAANDILAIFSLAEQALKKSGLDETAARSAVGDLMQTALQAARQHGPGPALTGALMRGDADTLSKHFAALDDFSAHALHLHKTASAVLFAHFVSAQLDPQQAENIRQLLDV